MVLTLCQSPVEDFKFDDAFLLPKMAAATENDTLLKTVSNSKFDDALLLPKMVAAV